MRVGNNIDSLPMSQDHGTYEFSWSERASPIIRKSPKKNSSMAPAKKKQNVRRVPNDVEDGCSDATSTSVDPFSAVRYAQQYTYDAISTELPPNELAATNERLSERIRKGYTSFCEHDGTEISFDVQNRRSECSPFSESSAARRRFKVDNTNFTYSERSPLLGNQHKGRQQDLGAVPLTNIKCKWLRSFSRNSADKRALSGETPNKSSPDRRGFKKSFSFLQRFGIYRPYSVNHLESDSKFQRPQLGFATNIDDRYSTPKKMTMTMSTSDGFNVRTVSPTPLLQAVTTYRTRVQRRSKATYTLASVMILHFCVSLIYSSLQDYRTSDKYDGPIKYMVNNGLNRLIHNPGIGPNSYGLHAVGILNPAYIIFQNEYWRLLTCTTLNSGIIPLFLNITILCTIGSRNEKRWGTYSTACIIVVSGLGGAGLSLIFAQDEVCCAGGASVLGLLGAARIESVFSSAREVTNNRLGYNSSSKNVQWGITKVAHILFGPRSRSRQGMLIIMLVLLGGLPFIDYTCQLGGLLLGCAMGMFLFAALLSKGIHNKDSFLEHRESMKSTTMSYVPNSGNGVIFGMSFGQNANVRFEPSPAAQTTLPSRYKNKKNNPISNQADDADSPDESVEFLNKSLIDIDPNSPHMHSECGESSEERIRQGSVHNNEKLFKMKENKEMEFVCGKDTFARLIGLIIIFTLLICPVLAVGFDLVQPNERLLNPARTGCIPVRNVVSLETITETTTDTITDYTSNRNDQVCGELCVPRIVSFISRHTARVDDTFSSGSCEQVGYSCHIFDKADYSAMNMTAGSLFDYEPFYNVYALSRSSLCTQYK